MAGLNLCISFLLLCLAGISLQRGITPQRNDRVGLYLPSYIRGTGVKRPGVGPAGVKAGRYPIYGIQEWPTGMGYRVPAGYGAGYRGVGYPYAALPFGVLGPKSKTLKSGYGAGGIGFPITGPQPNKYGAQTYYGTQLGGSVMDPTAAKYGGQLSYDGQPQQPVAEGLGGDYSAGSYGAYGSLGTGKVPGGYGPGQVLGSFEGKESNYGKNAFLGNKYRVHCASGKC